MKRIAFLVICLGVFALLVGVAGIALAAEENTSASSFSISPSASPKSISGPQEVSITITITHLGETMENISITLVDPNRTPLSLPSSTLSPGATVTYSGKWTVTQAELDSGKIVYNLSWGNTTRAVPVAISKASSSSSSSSSSAVANLTASYVIMPENASKGQTVTLAYTLYNGNDVDVVDVAITNTNLGSKNRVSIPRIAAGETVTQNFQYTMGAKSVTSKPKVTYKAEGASKTTTIANIGTKTIKFEKTGVTANLRTSSKTEVLPGAELSLTLNLANTSSVTYKDVRVSSPQLGEIATGLELRANGGKQSVSKAFVVSQSDEYSFKVTGTGSDGKTLDISSNFIRVTALDMSRQLQFSIQATTESLEIYHEPAVVDFMFVIRNIGEATGNDLMLMHGPTAIANIGALAPGEERVLAKRLEVSMQGEFGFSVTGLNGQGVSQTVTQNKDQMVRLTYAQPTPRPTDPPPPTQPPDETEATDVPVSGGAREDSGGGGMTLRWVLAGVLMAALAAVLGMIVVNRRRQSREEAQSEAAIDSMQRGSRRDYTGNTSKHKPIQDVQRSRRDGYDDADGIEYEAKFYADREELPKPRPKPVPAPPPSSEEGVSLTSGMSMSELAATYGRPDEETPTRTIDEATNAYLARMREPVEKDEAPLRGVSGGYGDQPEYTRRRRARSADA